MRARVALGVCLLLIWYVVAAYFAVVFGGLTVALLWIVGNAPGPSSGTVRLAIASAVVTVLIVVNVVRSSLRPPLARGSTALDRDQAPDLWRMLDELADACGLATPTEVRLVPDAEIWTVERGAMLGLLGGPRVLYLGIPLALGLEPGLLRAAICHELGHWRSGHLRYGALTYRASDAIDGVLRGVRQPMDTSGHYAKLMARPLAIFAFFYQRITLKARRAHEYEADATAASVTGSDVTADMLRTIYALERVWRDYKKKLKACLQRGARPDDPFAAFTALLAEEKTRAELRAYRTGPLPSVTRRLDSHPSLAARVARIEQLAAPATLTTPIDATGYRNQVNDHARGSIRYLASALGARSETRVEPWQGWLAQISEGSS